MKGIKTVPARSANFQLAPLNDVVRGVSSFPARSALFQSPWDSKRGMGVTVKRRISYS